MRKPITFYNWECPLRTTLRPVSDSALELECDFLDDESSVEKTRLIDRIVQEKQFVDQVLIPLRDELGIEAKYIKFISDTNPDILYPNTVRDRKNEAEIRRKMLSFAQRMQRRADVISRRGNIQIFLFSQIRSLYPDEYLRVYNEVYYSFSQEDLPQTKFFPQKFFKNELEELAAHTGVSLESERKRLVELTKRVASCYAAEEYIIRNALSQTDWFQNPVCVSNESMFNLPVFANAYLGKNSRGPWIFVLYKPGDEKK